MGETLQANLISRDAGLPLASKPRKIMLIINQPSLWISFYKLFLTQWQFPNKFINALTLASILPILTLLQESHPG